MSKIVLAEQSSAPDTPGSGKVALYVDSNGDLSWKDDAGNINKITSTGGYTLTITGTGTAVLLGSAHSFNECTDPVAGDYLWIVDTSASNGDRKVNAGHFASHGGEFSKSAVASNSATNILDITVGGGADIAVSLLISVTSYAPGRVSNRLYAINWVYNLVAVNSLGVQLFNHTSLSLTGTVTIGSRKLTLSVTQVNGSAGADTVKIDVIQVGVNASAALTFAAL